MTEEELIQEINKLNKKWFHEQISTYHKDRDCHFYISCFWSYGEGVKYQAQHYGYLLDHFEGEKRGSFKEALQDLYTYMSTNCKEEREDF